VDRQKGKTSRDANGLYLRPPQSVKAAHRRPCKGDQREFGRVPMTEALAHAVLCMTLWDDAER